MENTIRVCLTLIVGLDEFGNSVCLALEEMKDTLPANLSPGLETVFLDTVPYAESLAKIKAAKDVLIGSETTKKINLPYIIVGQGDENIGMDVTYIFIWETKRKSDSIPKVITDYIDNCSGVAESYIGICSETDEWQLNIHADLNMARLQLNLVNRRMQDKSIISEKKYVSKVASLLFLSFIPDTAFELRPEQSGVYSLGIAGEYGLHWSSEAHLRKQICSRLVDEQLHKGVADIEKLPMDIDVKKVLTDADPKRLSKKMFLPDTSGILESQAISARAKWKKDFLEIEMTNAFDLMELTEDIPAYKWTDRLRHYISLFDLTKAWRWKMVLHLSCIKIKGTLRKTIPHRIMELFDTKLHAPAQIEYLLKGLHESIISDRNRQVYSSSDCDATFKRFDQALVEEPSKILLLLRTALIFVPITLLGAVVVYYGSDKSAVYPIIWTLFWSIVLGLPLYFKMKSNVVSDLFSKCYDSVQNYQSANLSENVLDYTDEIAATLSGIRKDGATLLTKYKQNLMSVKANDSEIDDKTLQNEDAIGCMKPILSREEEYSQVIEGMKIPISEWLEDAIRDGLLDGIYSEEWNREEFIDKISEYVWHRITVEESGISLPDFLDLIHAVRDNSKIPFSLEGELEALRKQAIPMISTRNIRGKELIIGYPEVLKQEVEAIKKYEFTKDNLYDFQLLYCITRVYIRLEGE